MPRTIRFHLDEICDPRIAAALRQRGVDVTTAGESGLLGSPDTQHLAFASTQGRAMVTHITDFLRLHADGNEHCGIINRPVRPLGDLIRSHVLVWEVLDAAEMRGCVEFL